MEDNDDLVPIFSSQSDRLEQTYGKFFVSELIEAQDENMQCFVAEVRLLKIIFALKYKCSFAYEFKSVDLYRLIRSGGRHGCGLHECVEAGRARPPEPLLPARALPRAAQADRCRRSLRAFASTHSHPISQCALNVMFLMHFGLRKLLAITIHMYNL